MRPILLAIVVAMLVACGPSQFVKDGDALYARGNFQGALASYEAALAEKPDSPEIQNKVRTTREQYFLSLLDESRQALGRDDLIGAMVAARKANTLAQNDSRGLQLNEDISTAVDYRALKLLERGDFGTALMLHEVAIRELPGPHQHAETAQHLRLSWQDVLLKQSQAAESANLKGEALLIWGKLAQLSSDPAHHDRRVVLLKELLSELEFRVAVEATNTHTKPVTDALQSTRLGTLAIVKARELPHIKADLQLSKTVTEDFVQQRWSDVTYESGRQQVPNPSYSSRLNDVEREQRYLTEAENDVTRLENEVTNYEQRIAREEPNVSSSTRSSLESARNSLRSARDRVISRRNDVMRAREALNREPQFRDEPVYSIHQYPVDVYTRIGSAELRITLKGAQNTEVTVPLSRQYSDETHPAQPAITGVGANPLNLPDPADFTRELQEDAVAASREAIFQTFDNWRQTLLEQAEQQTDDARRVDLLVRYLVADLERPNGQVTAEIKTLRGIPDAVNAILGR